jgi:hypothetical protein
MCGNVDFYINNQQQFAKLNKNKYHVLLAIIMHRLLSRSILTSGWLCTAEQQISTAAVADKNLIKFDSALWPEGRNDHIFFIIFNFLLRPDFLSLHFLSLI